jgi:hypothetical protein
LRKRLSKQTGSVLENTFKVQSSAADGVISLDKRALIVHEGNFESSDGAISFNKERLKRVVKRNNDRLEQLSREYSGNVPNGAYPPIYEDHTDNTHSTIGRLIGPLSYEERDIPNVGSNIPCIVSECTRFLGAENCERASDGRIFHLSIGIDESQDDLITELSVVPEPAAPGAMLLSKDLSKLASSSQIKAIEAILANDEASSDQELEKHFINEIGVSASEAKAWVKKRDRYLKHLKGEKKMSKNNEAMQGLKRLAGELKGLKTKLIKSSSDVKHMAKRNKVEGELRGLVRMRKMSPAEFRLAKMDDMAKLDDSAFNLVIDSYKNRSPIVEAGQIGTTEGLEAGAMAQEIGLKRLKSETKKELKRLGAKVRMSEEEEKNDKNLKKLEAAQEDGEKEMSEGFAGSYTKEMAGKYEEHMKHLEAAVEAGDHEKAKEHLGHMKKMAEEQGGHPVKHLAFGGDVTAPNDAQSAKIAELEEQVGKINAVVERIAAGLDKLMEVEKEEGHEELGGEKALESESKEDGEKKLGSEDEEKKDEKHLEGEDKDKEKHLESEARKDMGLKDEKEEDKKDLSAAKDEESEEDKK